MIETTVFSEINTKKIIEMKVITDGTEQLIDLLANEMIRLSSSTRFDMNSCLLHKVVTKNFQIYRIFNSIQKNNVGEF